jgi:hypothetical protein
LGWLDSTSENLQINNPIEQNFSLSKGEVTITVPDVPERDNYILCLFGDSGDITEPFTIEGGQGSASPPASSTPSVPSTQTSPSPILSPTTPSPTTTSPTGTSSPTTTPTSTPTGTSQPTSAVNNSGASAMITPGSPLLSILAIFMIALFV